MTGTAVSSAHAVGILLAAGRGRRFDPAGQRNKLHQLLPDGDAVAVASALHLLAALPTVLAVVRADDDVLPAQLRALGCTVSPCADADQGMGVSLVHGLLQCADASIWVIALGDMPHVLASTPQALVLAIQAGADIAVPVCDGRRGNPVAFSRRHLSALLLLDGDQGARHLLKNAEVCEVMVDDRGVLQDIDLPADLD